MTDNKVQIRKLPSGVPGLDEILGGGFPEFSFNIIAGAPGCGKTTLAHQFIFANATPEHPAIYFTVLGEPALKMLRYQQQYTFFDESKLNDTVRFVNLSEQLISGGLKAVLAEISQQVQAVDASIVVVDSFRTALRIERHVERELRVEDFVQQLALQLTSLQATTFLIGEYGESELHNNPVFTVSDGLFWLYQSVERNSMVRKLQIMKLRGQQSVPGLHTFRITDSGIQAFSRTLGLAGQRKRTPDRKRLSTGSAELDEMMGGGIPEGDSALIAGPSGTGKSLLATEFIMAGLQAGEAGIITVFEERPEEYVDRAMAFGLDLRAALNEKRLEIIYMRPLDLSVDEMMQELIEAVQRTKASRLVIDSIAGFELALAPGFRAEFRESLYRMILALTGVGITILSTLETQESFDKFPLSSHMVSFLTDDIIRMRYAEIGSQIRKLIMVIKMRGGAHSNDIREYEIKSDGIAIDGQLKDYVRLLTGIPEKVSSESSHKPGTQPSDVTVTDGGRAKE